MKEETLQAIINAAQGRDPRDTPAEGTSLPPFSWRVYAPALGAALLILLTLII